MNERKRFCLNKITIAGILFAAFSVLTALILFKLCGGIYYNNDDILMRSIAEGTFTGTPDGHLIFEMYVLGSFIAGLYKLFPQVNWYDLIAIGFHIASVSVMAVGIGLCSKGRLKQTVISVISYMLIMGIDASMMVNSKFTVVSSVLFSAGIVCLAVWTREKNALHAILSIFFVICSLLYRKEVFLMGIPIFVIVLLFMLLGSGVKENIKRVIIFLLSFVGIAVISIAVEIAAYSSDEWNYYKDFNESRAELEDYVGVPVYEFSKDAYDNISMTKADSIVLGRLDISFVDEYTLETSKDLVSASKVYVDAVNNERGISYLLSRIKKEFKNTWNQPIVIALFTVGFAGLLLSILNRHWLSMLSTLALFAYQILFSGYFLYKDRFPERVWYGLYFMLLTAFTLILLREILSSALKRKTKVYICIPAVCLLAFFIKYCVGVQNYRINYYYKDLYEEHIEESADLYRYCYENSENYYLLDSSVTMNLTDTMLSNGYKDTANQIPLSYWTNGSPLFEKKKENAGLESLSEALISRDDVFLVQKESENTDWIVNYYESNGIEVSLSVEDSFSLGGGTATVYRVLSEG